MITFGIVPRNLAAQAYRWHRGFAGNSQFLFPRKHESYLSLVEQGRVWLAWDENQDFLASAYSILDEKHGVWEIGGLMVIEAERGKGVGGVLGRLVVGTVLLGDTPLKRGHSVIAHIHAENESPRRLFLDALKFDKPDKPQEFDGNDLPGLKQNAQGKVLGYELTMNVPATVLAIADWAEKFSGKVGDREVKLLLPSELDLKQWAPALRSMVPGPKPTLRRIR